MLFHYKQVEAKTASTDLTWLYFCLHTSIILYSVYLFCTQWSFFNRFFLECFVPNIQLLLKTQTHQVADFTVITYFTSNSDSAELSQK